ncbi:hypothetical protein, partial [Acinetobacter sp. ANC 4641]
AAGAVNATSKDAVNGGQLYNVSNSVKTVLGGNSSIAADGSISTSNIGGTGADTVDSAIAAVKSSATKAKTTVTQGNNIVVNSTTNADGSSNYEVATAKDLTVDSITAGNSLLNNTGLSINDGTGNVTHVTATGTQVTDGTHSSNYG